MAPSRQGRAFLLSLVFHGVLVGVVLRLKTEPPSPPTEPAETLLHAQRPPVFLPSAELLRELATEPPRPAPPPTPARPPSPAPALPTPDPPRDRISIGPRSDERRREPLVLRRDEDLTAPEGDPRLSDRQPPSPEPGTVAGDGLREGGEGAPPLELPPGSQERRPGRSGSAPHTGSLAESLRNLDRHLGQGGASIVGGRRMGPLFFDPEGADFTQWVNHFKNEVYRNWRVPQAARLGFRGHADIEFLVERDGSVVDLRIVKSSGTASLDRAAVNAILGSRLLPLPSDYAPPRAPMQVSFFYGQEPQGS